MPDFKIQTGNIADALTDFDAPELTGPIQTPESVIMPTAEISIHTLAWRVTATFGISYSEI